MRVAVDPERPNPRTLAPAVEALARGEVVVYPSDTGYAFACALSSRKGMATIRRLKGQDERSTKPLSVLVAELGDLGRFGAMGNRVFRSVRRLLPGPYTIVLPATAAVPRPLRNRDHEIGLRMPDHPLCRMLVELVGEPLITGSVTPGEAEPVVEDPERLEREQRATVAVVLDAGPLRPDPSTILRGDGDLIEVLREGQGPVPD